MKRVIIFMAGLAALNLGVVKAGYDSTYVLAIPQRFAIPEDVDDNDYVGVWRKTVTWQTVGTISFTIETNYFDAFAINSSTGLITINDATHIDGQISDQDEIIYLIIRTTDSGSGYDLDTAEIRVKENAYCKFIDLDYTGTESGTKAEPYNNRNDPVWSAGYGYFFKRGTELNTTQEAVVNIDATATNPMIIGAYGQGNKPIFDAESGDNVLWIFGNNASAADSCQHIYMYDLINRNSDRGGFYCRYGNNFRFYNIDWFNLCQDPYESSTNESCVVMGTSFYSDSLKNWGMEFINCVWDTITGTTIAALKFGCGYSNIINNHFKGISCSGVRLTMGKKINVKHNLIENIGACSGEFALQIKCDSSVIEDNRIINTVRAVSMELSTYIEVEPDGNLIKNLYVRDVSGYGFYINASTGQQKNNKIEDSFFKDAAGEGLHINRNTNMVWRYNYFENFPMLFDGSTNNNIYFYYNIGWGDDLICNAGTNYSILNNTWDDDINMTGVATETIRNNYFKSLGGTISTQSDNIDLDTINTSLHFIDYANHDYHLKLTATSAIDQAYDVSATRDFDDNSKSGAEWDIGAFEYNRFTPPTGTINAGKNDKIYLPGNVGKVYYVGKN